jgi:hypothetical protein
MCYKAIVQYASNYVINCKCNNNTINLLNIMQRCIQCTEYNAMYDSMTYKNKRGIRK